MGRRVLVPVDRSDHSESALEFALEQFPDDDIVALHVLDFSDLYMYGDVDGGAMVTFDEISKQQRREAEALLEELQERYAEDDREIETELREGPPARTIVEYATDEAVDQIVMGSHGRSGASRILLGSVAEAVARRSPVPVTIVR